MHGECQNPTISFRCSTLTYCMRFLSCVCNIALLKYWCFHLHTFFKNVKKKRHIDDNLTFVVWGYIWVESSQAVSCIDKEWIFESLGGCHRLLRDGYCDTHFVGRTELSQEYSVLQNEKPSYLPSFGRVVTSRKCTMDCTWWFNWGKGISKQNFGKEAFRAVITWKVNTNTVRWYSGSCRDTFAQMITLTSQSVDF